MRLLILGGTNFVGRATATDALARGHDVTCLARGTKRSPPHGARHVVADRTTPEAYDDVAGERWDAVIDVATQPGHVRSAVAALSGSTDHWLHVSTISVYADHSVEGADETAELLEPLAADEMGSMEDYGHAKVACEQAVTAALGPDRSLLARAGLIGGPGDLSGRTGYWPWRFAHPATDDGSVLVPVDPGCRTALIDVRDLAAWLVHCAGTGATGAHDVIANAAPLADHLATAREVAGHTGPVVEVGPEWLAGHGVAQWYGPRSLPLWVGPEDSPGLASRPTTRARAAGLSPRPLVETLADVLAWEGGREQPHGSGLTDEEERELVSAAAERSS
ncbi:oxidoreductase [Nocardioides sp. Root122]|uniref:NAD-dependent epimerase/dehydratase family protein n=1 Tax=Nocardioides TaxID=1839 RepID=UPI0007027C4B|nr:MULTISPECIES: NAD-dependent epimerase/dehydratase family protein [Nocardioides]KQV73482.1 oxidoreductase [Nocardioides sp. Root122]MCK9825258.1 NAD-dependent epimerase/dehydratase family protein [Nocardioides cavernae]